METFSKNNQLPVEGSVNKRREEDYLFPRFEKANQLTDLVQVLRLQHKTGRVLTDQIMQFGKMKSLSDTDENKKLVKLLGDFNGMYRPPRIKGRHGFVPGHPENCN